MIGLALGFASLALSLAIFRTRGPARPHRVLPPDPPSVASATASAPLVSVIGAVVAGVVQFFKRRRGSDLDDTEWQELPPPAGG